MTLEFNDYWVIPATNGKEALKILFVKKGMNSIGGQMGVESALGQGNTFWVEHPKVGDTL